MSPSNNPLKKKNKEKKNKRHIVGDERCNCPDCREEEGCADASATDTMQLLLLHELAKHIQTPPANIEYVARDPFSY